MCCKVKLKTLNQNMTASLWNHQKRRVCSDPCICTTQRYSFFFFQYSFARNLKNIFHHSFDIVVTSHIPTRCLIFCTNHTKTVKVKFLRNEEQHCLLPSLVDDFTCVHSKNALLTHTLSTLFSSTSVLFSCTPFGTVSIN